MNDCIFCKILADEIPAEILYQDDKVTAFKDINPAAPIHILIIPNRHIPSVNSVTEKDELLLGHLFTTARSLAQKLEIADSGYRLIVNTGPDGGQEVFHIHMHLLGGAGMQHPMG
jgi:histidine triad (HIT) family protein